MDRAIAAARRAFDETEWATDRALRQRCLRQLHEAIVSEQELFRSELVAEVGTPVMVTYMAQLDAPLAEGLLWPAEQIDSFAWERPLPDNNAFGTHSWQKVVKEPVGVVGAIIPWNYPVEITLNKLGQALATGNSVVVKPAPDTPWNATRIGRLIAEQTDIPPGWSASCPPRTTSSANSWWSTPGSTSSPSPARPPPGAGSWPPGPRRSSACSSSSAASRPTSSSTTPTSRPRWPSSGSCACTPDRAAPCSPAPSCPRRATTRRWAWPRPPWKASPTAIPPIRGSSRVR